MLLLFLLLVASKLNPWILLHNLIISLKYVYRIESLSASASGPNRTPLISSAASAFSRISSQIAASHATAVATQISSLASGSASASMVSESASNAASSAASVMNSLTSSASQVAQSQAPNAANSLISGYSTLMLQVGALVALFIASFVAMLA